MIPYMRPEALFESLANPLQITFSERFDPAKVEQLSSHLSRFPGVFKEITNREPKPRKIYTLSASEIRFGEKVRGPKGGNGHGRYDAHTDTVKVDPHMIVDDILINVVHEIIHAELPWVAERQVDELSDKIFDALRPSGRNRLMANKEPSPLGLDATRLNKGLWIGSKPETGRAVGESGFDLLVLCAEEYQPPGIEFPGVEVIHAPFDDNDLGPLPSEKQTAKKAAGKVAASLRRGHHVLVTCYEGRNRSGLVCGLALAKNGFDPLRAVRLIQRRRARALTNKAFVDLLTSS